MKAPPKQLLFELALIIGLSALAVFGAVLPGAPTWLRVVGSIIAMLAMASPLLLPAGLLVVYVIARRDGLVPRSAVHFVVGVVANEIEISHGEKRRTLRFASVARARVTRDDSWGESKILEDGVTLFDARRRTLAKFPLAADGAPALLSALRRAYISVDEELTHSPGVLD